MAKVWMYRVVHHCCTYCIQYIVYGAHILNIQQYTFMPCNSANIHFGQEKKTKFELCKSYLSSHIKNTLLIF